MEGRRKMETGYQTPVPVFFMYICIYIYDTHIYVYIHRFYCMLSLDKSKQSLGTVIQSMSFTSFSPNALTCRKVKGNKQMFTLRREPRLQTSCTMHDYS